MNNKSTEGFEVKVVHGTDSVEGGHEDFEKRVAELLSKGYQIDGFSSHFLERQGIAYIVILSRRTYQ